MTDRRGSEAVAAGGMTGNGECVPPAMIQLGGVAGCTGHIGKDTNPRPIISRLSRTRYQRVELGNNLLGALAEDDVFAGRMRL
jgi:hypothetical protein